MAVENDSGLEQFLRCSQGFGHEIDVLGCDKQGTGHEVTEPFVGLAVFTGELVDGSGRLAGDFLILETLGLQKGDGCLPISADPGMSLFQIVAGPAKVEHPYGLVCLYFLFDQSLDGYRT